MEEQQNTAEQGIKELLGKLVGLTRLTNHEDSADLRQAKVWYSMSDSMISSIILLLTNKGLLEAGDYEKALINNLQRRIEQIESDLDLTVEERKKRETELLVADMMNATSKEGKGLFGLF